MQKQVDVELIRAVTLWASKCEWPRWFARNIIVWRRARGLVWKQVEVKS